MAQEATIKINVEQDNSNKTLKDLKDAVKKVGDEAEKTGKKQKNNNDKAVKSTVSLKTQLKNLKDEMVQLDHNSPEFKQMAIDAGAMEDKIKDVDAQVRILSSDTKGLDALVGAGQAIGGAFQASQGAMALFGSESKEVQKAIQNVIAVQGIMNGVMAVSNAIRKESVVGQKLLVVWSKIVTASQWLWNLAMTANPIGIIVVAIALFVAGIVLLVKNVDKAIDFFKDWTNILFLMLGPIGWLILAYKALTDETESLEDARVRQTKEEKSRHKARLKQIERELEAFKKAEQNKQDNFDREIKRAKAEGKSVFNLELQKLESIKNVQEAQLKSYNLMLEAGIEHYKNQAKINGLSDEEFIEQTKRQGVDLLAIQADALAGQQKFKDAIFDAESDIMQLKSDNRKNNKSANSKASDNKNKQADKDAQAEKKRLEQARRDQEKENAKAIKDFGKFLEDKAKLEKEFFDSQLSEEDLEVLKVQEKYGTLLELARQYGEDTKILEEAQATELAEIRKAHAEVELQAKREANQAQAESVINNAQEILSIVSTIQELGNRKEINRIKEKQKAGEILSKSERKRLIQDEKQKRAIAVAEIAIDTARAIASAVASGARVPFPGNIPAIIAGVGAVLANVASATKILNAPLPSFDSASGSDVAGSLGGDATQNAPNINPNQSGNTLLNEPPIQVVVLESDITNVQNNVNVIEQQATFG